jgi:hypothetical protein
MFSPNQTNGCRFDVEEVDYEDEKREWQQERLAISIFIIEI